MLQTIKKKNVPGLRTNPCHSVLRKSTAVEDGGVALLCFEQLQELCLQARDLKPAIKPEDNGYCKVSVRSKTNILHEITLSSIKKKPHPLLRVSEEGRTIFLPIDRSYSRAPKAAESR